MNKVILLGRLTKDPEIKLLETNQTKIASFTIAVNRKYARQGEERGCDFINIVTFSKLAEFVEKYLKKGLQICLCGRLQVRNYEDSEGIKHYVTEVVSEEINFADSHKKDNDNLLNTPSDNSDNTQNEDIDNTDVIYNGDEDIPF